MNIYIKIILVLIFFSNNLFSDITIAFAKYTNVNIPSSKQVIEIDKIKKIAKKNNIKVSFKGVPWTRALLMLEKGVIDGAINASYKKNRARYSMYPMKNTKLDGDRRLNEGNTYYIFRHIDSPLRWNGKVFLNGGTVGVKAKYAVISDLKKHSNIKIEEFILNSELVRKLSAKKLDAYAGSFEEVNNLINKYPYFSKNIIKESLPIRKKEYFIIFSKKTYKKKSEEMEKIWSGLKEINRQNKLDKK